MESSGGVPVWLFVSLVAVCAGLVVLVFWQMRAYRRLGQMYLVRTRALDPVERYRFIAMRAVEEMRKALYTKSESEQLDAWLTLNSAVRAALTPDAEQPASLEAPRWPRG